METEKKATCKPINWIAIVLRFVFTAILLSFSLYNMTIKGISTEPIWMSLVTLVVGIEMDSTYAKAIKRAVTNSAQQSTSN